MKQPPIKAIYSPSDEPYLGNEHLLSSDQSIPPALQTNLEVARRTFGIEMSPLQKAGSALIPQGISIALSIRELVRQAYLYSAAILLRPLLERTSTIYWLGNHPDSLTHWHDGWPRRHQPSLEQLLSHFFPDRPGDDLDTYRGMLHKLVHADPQGAIYNILRRPDGDFVFPSGKIVDHSKMCSVLCITGELSLRHLVKMAERLFPTDGQRS